MSKGRSPDHSPLDQMSLLRHGHHFEANITNSTRVYPTRLPVGKMNNESHISRHVCPLLDERSTDVDMTDRLPAARSSLSADPATL